MSDPRALDRPEEDDRSLEERLRFHSQLLDAVGQAVIAIDLDGRITFWNHAAERLYGWSGEEAVGCFVVSLLAPVEERERVEDALQGTLRDPHSTVGEFTLRHRDGRHLVVEARGTPIVDRDGVVVGRVGTTAEISDRKEAERRLRRRAEAQLRESREELQRLYAHLLVVREAEQRRIARDLHDELGQMLTALKLEVASLRRRWGSDGAEPLGKGLEQTAQLVDATLDATRRIAMQLRPVALDDLGLEAALEWLVEEMAGRAGFAWSLDSRLDDLPADTERDTAAFRIVQEALTNVAKHANAGRVQVRAVHEGGQLRLSVSDDGSGILPAGARATGSMGIAGMRERARACGGELTVRRRPGGGTRVTARLPDPSREARQGKEGSADDPAGGRG